MLEVSLITVSRNEDDVDHGELPGTIMVGVLPFNQLYDATYLRSVIWAAVDIFLVSVSRSWMCSV